MDAEKIKNLKEHAALITEETEALMLLLECGAISVREYLLSLLKSLSNMQGIHVHLLEKEIESETKNEDWKNEFK